MKYRHIVVKFLIFTNKEETLTSFEIEGYRQFKKNHASLWVLICEAGWHGREEGAEDTVLKKDCDLNLAWI